MSERFNWVLALSSGLLLGLAFPPFPFPWLAWIAYLPLLYALRHADWRTAAILSCSSHLLAYAIAGNWVLLHADPFTRSASAMGMVWLAVVTAVPWIVASAKRRPDGFPGLLWLVGAFGILDWMQLHTEVGFPWSALGNTQSEFEPFNQLAEYAGVTGLSMFALGLNIGFHAVLTARPRGRWILLGSLAGLIGGAAFIGSARIKYLTSATASASATVSDQFRVLAVQPSVPIEHWLDAASEIRIDSLSSHTEQALKREPSGGPGYDLIVWPETSIPPTQLSSTGSLDGLRHRVRQWGVPLLSGGIEISAESDLNSPYWNAVFLLEPDTGSVQSYRKQRLVPFAEHVPYSTVFPQLQRFAVPSGGVWGYSPGTRDGLFEVRHPKPGLPGVGVQSSTSKRIGVLICFESSFGYLSNRLAQAGAQLIVVVTQDGWWGKSFGYQQHLAFNRLRAIETRLPLVQVSATGLTAFVSPTGRVVSKLDWMERGALSWHVPIATSRGSGTIYTRFGDWIGSLCAILTFFLILAAIHKRSSARQRPSN